MTSIARIACLAVLAILVAGCGGGPTPSPTLAPRLSSPATVRVVAPEQGATVSGPSTRVVLELVGAVIVPETTTTIRPDEGHVHLYVDNQIVSMNYGLEQDIPVTVGTHAIKAEFVAADHAPFNPRIWTDDVVFTVR